MSLVPRSLACCSPCVVTRSPPPGMPQGERWLSHVPECPLWTQAPLSAPSGGLRPRPTAPRTAACRSVETVGLPRRTTGRDILLSTTLPVSGLYHAACVLAPPGSIRPLAGRHAGAFLTGWRGVDQGGLEPCDSHPLGNRNQFHGFAPNPKVSSLPWRDHCLVRRRLGQGPCVCLGIFGFGFCFVLWSCLHLPEDRRILTTNAEQDMHQMRDRHSQ